MSTTQAFATKSVADDKSVDYDGPFDSAKAPSAPRLSAEIEPSFIFTDLTAEQIEALSYDELDELVMDWYWVLGGAEELLCSVPWIFIDDRPMFRGSEYALVVDFEVGDTDLCDIAPTNISIDFTLRETEAGYAARVWSLEAAQDRA